MIPLSRKIQLRGIKEAAPCVPSISRLKVMSLQRLTDIDQTDLHRFEPSSRRLLSDEHSHQ